MKYTVLASLVLVLVSVAAGQRRARFEELSHAFENIADQRNFNEQSYEELKNRYFALLSESKNDYVGNRAFNEDMYMRNFMTLDVSADEASTKTLVKIVGETIPRIFKLIQKLMPETPDDRRLYENVILPTKNFAEGWQLHLSQDQLTMITKELFAVLDKITKAPIKAEIKLTGY
uniref:DUF885 domain-containing protein n=1 Tax=Rhabditophanes sp. KR3021 TaxID=114890 RepID=A0AC35TQ34_9BILA